MNHFVVIRFNTGNTDPDWLEHRMKFFRAFTAPSLRSQTNQNFTPVLLVDPSTPDSIVDEIKEVGLVYKINSGQKFAPRDTGFKSFLTENTDDEWVITSRLDSDDGYAKDFIERTQSVALKKNEFIMFNNGMVWKNDKFFLKTQVAPPFISYIEKVSTKGKPIGTVFTVKTHERALQSPNQQYTDRPKWLMVSHDKNMITEKNGLDTLGKEVSLEEAKQHFEMELSWLK